MASTNQSPFYKRAEEDFLLATTPEEKISCLEIMIKECPKHKGAEKMLAQLKTRHKKLKASLEKSKKSGKGSKQGIRKADMQFCICGMPNTGKSTIFNILTNQNSPISEHGFTTFQEVLGSTNFEDIKIQTIDCPPFPNNDKSLLYSTDTILLVIDNREKIKESLSHIPKTNAKLIILYNKTDKLSEKEKRKIQATLKSKYKYDFLLFSSKTNEKEIETLKKKIFETFPIIRIYTKEPRKPASKEPMILKKDSTTKNAAEKILKGLSRKIKLIKIWGPSAKFQGQGVGLHHVLKDKDIIELQVK